MEGMSHLEPLDYSVLNAARGDWSRKEASVCEPLEHLVRMMTLDDSPLGKMSDDEPLEHSVLTATVTCWPVAGAPVLPPLQCSEDGGPPFGPDHDLTLSDGPHTTGIVDRILDGSVPLPAVDVGRVAWSPADGWLPTGDGNSDGCITTGFQHWNTVMFTISMRHLMVCQCIMAVICMIQRIRIGTTRTPLPAWRM